MYDPVVARFLSVDPKRIGASPYIGMANDPIGFMDPDGGGPTSTHTDKDGNVVAVYNDGDLGVYKHDDLSGWNGTDVLAKEGSGVTFMGNTLHIGSFADFEHFQETGELIPGGGAYIDFNSNWAYEEILWYATAIPNFGNYAMNASNNERYDIKTKAPGSFYYGSKLYFWGVPTYASARDAGNVLAGVIAAKSGLDYHTAFSGFGSLELSKTNGIGNKWTGLGLFLFDKIFPFTLTPPTYYEDDFSYYGIKHGYTHYKNF